MGKYGTTDTDSIFDATFSSGRGTALGGSGSSLMGLFQSGCRTTDVDAIFSSRFGRAAVARPDPSWGAQRDDGLAGTLQRLIRHYPSVSTRIQANLRFMLLGDPMLREISRRLPRSGRILDLGCGAGFLASCSALAADQRVVVGVDRDPERIREARVAAAKLQLSNVSFDLNDVLDWKTSERWSAICLVDVLRDLPTRRLSRFLAQLVEALEPGGQLIIAESEWRPRWKSLISATRRVLGLGFGSTRRLARAELTTMLERNGLEVSSCLVRETLLSSHRLYECRRI